VTAPYLARARGTAGIRGRRASRFEPVASTPLERAAWGPEALGVSEGQRETRDDVLLTPPPVGTRAEFAAPPRAHGPPERRPPDEADDAGERQAPRTGRRRGANSRRAPASTSAADVAHDAQPSEPAASPEAPSAAEAADAGSLGPDQGSARSPTLDGALMASVDPAPAAAPGLARRPGSRPASTVAPAPVDEDALAELRPRRQQHALPDTTSTAWPLEGPRRSEGMGRTDAVSSLRPSGPPADVEVDARSWSVPAAVRGASTAAPKAPSGVPRSRREAVEPAEIIVRIGRVEVRTAAPDPAPERVTPTARRHASSLDDYLRSRANGRVG
jgi:hypothetical protein